MNHPIQGAYPLISDYAIVGNCRSTALISKEGSVDWMCLPRVDSPSVFGAILDATIGGRFRIRPVGPFNVERQYVDGTNVLETTFRTPAGTVVLRDLMPVADESTQQRMRSPDHELLRELQGMAGEVEIEILYEPRPDYGKYGAKIERRGALGLWLTDDRHSQVLLSDIPLDLSDDRTIATARAVVRTGERRYLSLSHSSNSPAVIPPLGDAAAARIETTVLWWRGWTSQCAYDGPYRAAVVRSALTLKLMSYAPSGALVAAPTTSLPEHIGGERNWDYRYCWLRDSSSAMRALLDLGYNDEAQSFLNWMLNTTTLTRPELHIVYDVFGNARLTERTLDHLEGYAWSRPVRIGNAAYSQLQLDVYGEVLAAAYVFANRGGKFDRHTATLLEDIGRAVSRRWREPDEGIWETRGGRKHHTHSKVMCWVALDRLVKLSEMGAIPSGAGRFRTERDAIRADVEAYGYSPLASSYVRTYGSREMDASLLTLPLFGYMSATEPHMLSTYRQVREVLGRGDLLYRYASDDGLPPGEGTFGVCAFWGVECEALQGRLDVAQERFEALLRYSNDVGLFSEEIEADTGMALGNFPQAFTHLGLINAALTLEREQRRADESRARLAATRMS